MDMQELGIAIAKQGEQIKELGRRMDNLEKLTDNVSSLALSVERLTNSMDTMNSQLTSRSGEVGELKDKPAKRWDAIIGALIAAIVGGAVGVFLKEKIWRWICMKMSNSCYD